MARELGLAGLPVAAVTGDDVLDVVTGGGFAIDETGAPVASLGDALVSANAYIGAEPIVDALAQGARVVVTGRVADPSLFVGPHPARVRLGRRRLAADRPGHRSSATCSSAPGR